MARLARVVAAGESRHLTQRGNDRQRTFGSEASLKRLETASGSGLNLKHSVRLKEAQAAAAVEKE